jgi:cyclopropane fatty-acyl-phospholipid synthase-like methyltransferase
MTWKSDHENKFVINSDIIRDYFNKKADLVFSDEFAKYEEAKLVEYLKRQKKISVLDLGCGNGRWAGILRGKLSRYVGIDFSETFIKHAKVQYPDEAMYSFNCMPAQNYRVNEKYDVIFIIGLLTYLNDDQIRTMVENIKMMLHSDGTIFVRNVTVDRHDPTRKVYDRKLNIIEKIFGRMKYQLIRRSPEEEILFFKGMNLIDTGYIEKTNYIYYLFRNENE